MSGGVDSSVAAALLQEQGYEVIGVTLQVWPTSTENERACCSLAAVEDARRVAAHLGIPHYVLNVQDSFFQAVITPFIESYRRGETPNPCILCNRRIKFGLLLETARKLGANCVATGHYAQIRRDGASGRWYVRRGEDARKDQSYVLYSMTQDQLAHTLLPLHGLEKTAAREIAAARGLHLAHKRDSQEICFIPDNDYRAFLRAHAPDIFKPGELVDRQGMLLGTHEGIAGFTIGQRKRLGITTPEPRYVVDILPQENRVVIGEPPDLLQREVAATEIVYGKLDAHALQTPQRVTAKLRATMTAQPGVAYVEGDRLRVRFDTPQRAVTPGQALVCYVADDIAAGGVITRNEQR